MKEKTLVVQVMQDYILGHMEEEITLADLMQIWENYVQIYKMRG